MNGAQVGTMRGAFIRGIFDITAQVKPGQPAVVAVLVTPQPHPGVPHEHTLRDGVGQNGGITAHRRAHVSLHHRLGLARCRARSRHRHLAKGVSLGHRAGGREGSAGHHRSAAAENRFVRRHRADDRRERERQAGRRASSAAPSRTSSSSARSSSRRTARSKSRSTRRTRPRCTSTIRACGGPTATARRRFTSCISNSGRAKPSPTREDVDFGVRKISYSVPGTDTLTISVNGVPIFIRGGDWGLDEAMKRIPRERLDAEIRLHKLANLNLIRNWVGQSTGEDFYELCDKYGILVWDEFFQPNPLDGPDPTDIRHLHRQCARQGSALPQPSFDRPVVRAQRGLSAAGDRRGSAQACSPSSSPRAAISPVPPTAPACARTGRTTGARRASFTPSPTTTSRPKPAASPCPRSNPSTA